MTGRAAVVTGAARGIGAATAVRLAEAGADLLLLDIGQDLPECPYPMGTEEQLKATAEACRAVGVRVEARAVDVRDQEELDAAVAEANAAFGRIDLLVNNAGIVGPSGSVAHETTEQEWQVMLDVNLSGAWRAAKAVLPAMAEARSGSIVNIASTAGSVAFRLFAGYVSAKHGVVGLTKALAVDYAPFGIRVNAVSPTSVYESPVESPAMLSGVADIMNVDLAGYERTSRQLHPLGTLVYPEDVAAAVCWLASDEAARVTGTVLSVDAGFTAR